MKPLLLILLCGAACATARPNASATIDARPGIDAFNRALHDATLKMDNAATLALWEDDGISLLPSTKPIVGKKAIAELLDAVMAQLSGATMTSFTSDCFDLEVSGDWASEWCVEHQVVELGGGKPPFDGKGKMLFVLHRGADGKWRIEREMWNQAGQRTTD